MIIRIWHGWTSEENADRYENLLKTVIFPRIQAKSLQGYLGIQLLRRELGNEVEFATLMRFESLQSVKEFTGEDYATAYVPTEARQVLARFDEEAQHYEVTKDFP